MESILKVSEMLEVCFILTQLAVSLPLYLYSLKGVKSADYLTEAWCF
jgi:hypothetical protein